MRRYLDPDEWSVALRHEAVEGGGGSLAQGLWRGAVRMFVAATGPLDHTALPHRRSQAGSRDRRRHVRPHDRVIRGGGDCRRYDDPSVTERVTQRVTWEKLTDMATHPGSRPRRSPNSHFISYATRHLTRPTLLWQLTIDSASRWC